MKEVYEDAINYLKYYGEKNDEKIERISYFLEKELKDYIQLQSNWNNLIEWLEKNYKESHDIWYVKIFNKMNELESGDK